MKTKEKIFQTILTDYEDMIYRLCCAYVADPDIRKDLYQNILLRLWNGLRSFEHRSSVGTWVYRISVNTGMDFFRKENKNRIHSKHLDIDKVDLADQSNNIEDELINLEKMQLMYKCINKLTFIDKTIISLYLEDLSHKNISDIIGISEKNVSVKLHRIKKKLNYCLKDV